MARNRIKKGILEFSTNPERNKLSKEYIIEVVCSGVDKLSHAYNLLGKKKNRNGNGNKR